VTSKDRLLLNGQRILRVLREFSFESNVDVEINYITDNDGTEETYTMWSIRKIMDNLRGVISGHMTEAYYIDNVDGDDENTGSSSSPFKTIEKAISIIDPGMSVHIYLKRGQNFTPTVEYRGVVGKRLSNNSIQFGSYGDDSDDIPKIKFSWVEKDDDASMSKFTGFNCWINFYKVDIEVQDYDGDCTTEWNNIFNEYSSMNLSFYESTINLGNKGNLIEAYAYGKQILMFKASKIIGDLSDILRLNGGTMDIGQSSLTIEGTDGADKVLKDIVAGVVRDADSGIPINVLSYSDLSD